MSMRKRTNRWVLKKRAKPAAGVLQSARHQALKLLAKDVKNVKTILILKSIKKTASYDDSKETDSSLSQDTVELTRKELAHREWLKSLNHSDIAERILASQLEEVFQPNIKSTDEALSHKKVSVDESTVSAVSLFLQQKRIKDCITSLKEKAQIALEKNNKLRSLEQKLESKAKKKQERLNRQAEMVQVNSDSLSSSDIARHRMKSSSSIGTNIVAASMKKRGQSQHVALLRKNQAVFLDTLDGSDINCDEDDGSDDNGAREDRGSGSSRSARELAKIQKSLRNKQNRIVNKRKQDGTETDSGRSITGQDGDSYLSSKGRKSRGPGRNGFAHQSLAQYMPLAKRTRQEEANTQKKATSSGSNNSSYQSRSTALSNRTSKEPQVELQPAQAVKRSGTKQLAVAAASGKDWQKSSTGVHPSWAAKQQAKLKLGAGGGTLPAGAIGTNCAPSNKKVVFDD